MSWWDEKPMRVVQTNLREIDVPLDVDEFAASLRDLAAEVVIFNVGGIVANYPTAFPWHWRNPRVDERFLGRLLDAIHASGMRLVARFDFSKVNQAIALDHPDWLYRSVKGEPVNYNGQVHVCVNSAYQQECSIAILREVLTGYAVDGVFFNMIGYQTTDYDGTYHGPCHCASCVRRFQAASGLPLPSDERGADAACRAYARFRAATARELFHRITEAVKRERPELAVCTYTHEGVDIYRRESGSALDRPLPEWTWSASANVKTVHGSWPRMAVSNAAVHFVDFPYRHVGVSPHLTAQRLLQAMANGGWLDYYVIGTLRGQEDRSALETVRRIFEFHRDNQRWFTNVRSVADALLVVPESTPSDGSMREFRGIYRMLAECHVLIDLAHDSLLESSDAAERISRYGMVVLPDVRRAGGSWCRALESYISAGGRVLATGRTGTCDSDGAPLDGVRPACLGIAAAGALRPARRGSYFEVAAEDRLLLGDAFDDLDLVYLDGEVLECLPAPAARGLLRLLPGFMYGPPEKCYGKERTDVPGVIASRHGSGRCAYLPWGIGAHYEARANHCHAALLRSIVEGLLGLPRSARIEASPLVDVTVLRHREEAWTLVNAVNLSGQLGTAFHAPIAVRDVRVDLRLDRTPTRARCLLRSGEAALAPLGDRWWRVIIPEVGPFECVAIETEPGASGAGPTVGGGADADH